MMDRLSETGVQRWMKAFDPSVYLGYARIPFLFLTGNNDTAYQLYAYRKSCALVPDSLRTISIRPGMLHGHYEGWEPDEIRCFFDGVLNGGCPLVRVGKAVVTDSIRVPYDSRLSSLEGTFYFRTIRSRRMQIGRGLPSRGRSIREENFLFVRFPAKGMRSGLF